MGMVKWLVDICPVAVAVTGRADALLLFDNDDSRRAGS
jgi:hypothetical protein